MFKYLIKHARECVTILAFIVMGIFLLINPSAYSTVMVSLVGILLVVLGVIRFVRYFRTEAAEAAKGDDFYTGLLAVIVGGCCVLGPKWFIEAFPALAMFFGLLELLLGFQKLQKTVDALRLKNVRWYLPAVNALIYLIFGLIIVCNPGMGAVWTFTGITLILEGVADAVTLCMMHKGEKKEDK